MTQITLNIPDNELNFFMKLIEKFNYEYKIDNFLLSDEATNLLDERRATAKIDNFLPRIEVNNKISFK